MINNQVGFTTNCLDADQVLTVRMLLKQHFPVFHVNGDDIEAVVQTLDIALHYRQEYSEMFCRPFML